MESILNQPTNPLSNNLDHILEHTIPIWKELHNEKIFITGGTGFFGSWLLESLVWANKKLHLNIRATVLTRNKSIFLKKCPHFNLNNELTFLEGDIRNFKFPSGEFSHIIHAATDADRILSPELMLDIIIQGTAHTLEFAKHCNTKRFLYVSSGAVYGKQPPEISNLTEEYNTPIHSNSMYGLGKIKAEKMCSEYAEKYSFDLKIARCFAFVGPYLPLNGNFAIGNFILNALQEKPIIIQSDGTPYRSYLYAADLTIWLWTILVQGKKFTPYNVGSDNAFSLTEIANLVAKSFNSKIEVQIMQTPNLNILPERYVPDISRAKNELSLFPRINLIDAIDHTKNWYLSRIN